MVDRFDLPYFRFGVCGNLQGLQKNKKYYYKIVPSKGVNATIGVIRFSKKK